MGRTGALGAAPSPSSAPLQPQDDVLPPTCRRSFHLLLQLACLLSTSACRLPPISGKLHSGQQD